MISRTRMWHLAWHILRRHRLHRVGLLIRQHVVCTLSLSRPHLWMARWRNNGAVVDHGLDDTGGELLCVFTSLSAIIAMRVDASPDEEDKVESKGEEIADYCGSEDADPMWFLTPKLVYECIDVRTIGEVMISVIVIAAE